MILLAIIGAPHGIRGAVKVRAFTQSPEKLFDYGALQDETGHKYSLKLERVVLPDCVIATLEGVSNRNQAEALRGVKLYVERSQLPDLPEEEFYHTDLIGLPVQDLEGQDVGTVQAVSNFGAGDFLEIRDAHGHLYTILFTRDAVPVIQLADKASGGGIRVDRRFLLDAN